MDILVLKERIKRTIELGESQFREFKSAFQGEPGNKRPRETSTVSKDIAEGLVAFANADGGELLIGVEDNGTITGIPFSEKQIAVLLQAPRTGVHNDTPLPTPISIKIEIDGLDILYFMVEKSTTTIHQTSDGRCLQRRDLESAPVSVHRLQFERQEQLSREYDRAFIDAAEVNSLDFDLVKAVSEHTGRMSPEKSLQYLGLAEYGIGRMRLRRAALLLFSTNVQNWHPRCQVRILRIRGSELKTGRDYNVVYDETITGNILQLLTSSWEQLRPHLVETKLNEDALFKQQVMYPEDAVREALINAITHRDYNVEGKGIEISIYDDRMTVLSPGNLLSTISLADLRKQKGVHESRNAYIARVLKEIGYVREMGEGMRRIFRLMNDADLVAPEVASGEGQFSVTLFHKSVFSPADQAWLSGYRALKLTREEMLIAMLGREGQLISPAQIYNLLSLHDWDIYRTVIEQLSVKGVIFNTLTEAEKRKRAGRRKGTSNREIARLAVRGTDVLELSLSELYTALSKMPYSSHIDLGFSKGVIALLPISNIYRANPIRLIKLLKMLDLIDSANQPTARLVELMQKGPSSGVIREDLSGAAPTIPPPNLKAPTSPRGNRTKEPDAIYVGNLPFEVSEGELFEVFRRFGPVLSISVPRDYVSGNSRGFAFVKLKDREIAGSAMRELQGHSFKGRSLKLNWAR
ncbi:ATP-binding protein [Shinella sp. JR1-6]|uniref:ATP-binding protein n=1 Tax=Shinella sp. JR1-6 TaxID=2527671 RepID=UPI00140435AC|nr:ATP-binding protein [Shinella sp. JR1-6]